MKKIILVISIVVLSWNCQNKSKVEQPKDEYASFGKKISKDSVMSKEELFAKYAGLNEGDTINIKFASRIDDVCQKKGCWMNVDLVNDEKVFVKFKDYGFFMPLNSKNEQTIVNGKAFLSVESVAELKHYAKDAGKPQVEIDSIKTPVTTYGFLADGVLIKK
ncbi:DUF4920 domain-containing protein [Flavobacterium sp.]|uniref:DUF4920 domain-containing protein n=1 Tax=Flavobacterium sp. TaxID=239 RepID=UPI00286CDB69|nr:DUF4920 domain-containing protein [Flavobacterium sp.]